MKQQVGNQRLGSGGGMTVDLHGFGRSTHDLGEVLRTTMSAGTLVPCYVQPMQPGDSWEIDVNADVKTHPTVGPLFGSFKLQIDFFKARMGLYIAELHNNKQKIGLNMANVKLPLMVLRSKTPDLTQDLDNQQINPSSIFAYLGIRGLGVNIFSDSGMLQRAFNAIPFIMYHDIYGQYYANKQEEVGAVLHTEPTQPVGNIMEVRLFNTATLAQIELDYGGITGNFNTNLTDTRVEIRTNDSVEPDPDNLTLLLDAVGNQPFSNVWTEWAWQTDGSEGKLTGTRSYHNETVTVLGYMEEGGQKPISTVPKVTFFPLSNIDEMRERLLQNEPGTVFTISNDVNNIAPYGLPFKETDTGIIKFSQMYSQEGLLLKTYQSDKFNNWMKTEWIDGDNGINAISAIDTSAGFFTMDALLISKKVYNMLNRVAISGGTYNNWIEANYGINTFRNHEVPVYLGGLSKEVIFQEVISNAASDATGKQELGSLAGRGTLANKHKGGHIIAETQEAAYIMGIASLTPRIDYSQGNRWDMNLRTMDDWHKPGLDGIGYQDLITDQMAWWDTHINGSGEPLHFRSAGKQPAWINYQTSVNRLCGNFAIKDNEMFMTLARRYESNSNGFIGDLTTYIDPGKFNYIFAQTSRDAMNFWVQIAVDAKVRRVMSANQIPNL